MTLLREIQCLLERTYSAIEVNLEHCLIGSRRCEDLTREAGAAAFDLAPAGRTFLRPAEDRLHLGIFYAPALIRELEENDPRRGLNERNITPLITFIEEIAHGLQAALLFREGERRFAGEDFLRNLEAQAKVDTCLVLFKFAHLFCGAPIPKRVSTWIRAQIFDDSHRRFRSPGLRRRYGSAQKIAQIFLQRLARTPLPQRQEALRRFRALGWEEKVRLCSSAN